MRGTKLNAKINALVLLFVIILSSVLVNSGNGDFNESQETIRSKLNNPQIDGMQSIFDNQSFLDNIASFLSESQNDGVKRIKSMDDAFYIGMTLFYLKDFQTVQSEQLETVIFSFINTSRNSDGGYGNWDGSKSSMESTFQALKLLYSFNVISQLTSQEANSTLNYIQQLLTVLSGYFPIVNWDVPDITSTFRAIWIKDMIETEFVSLTPIIDSNATNYIEGNYIEPTSSDSTGYSEINGGELELLASNYAFRALDLLGIPEPNHVENVAEYLSDLISLTGGTSGYIGSLPTLGYTSAAIQLYLDMLGMGSFDVTEFVPSDFLDNAINYITANKIAGYGYSSSDRDTTPELSSTYFALKALWLTEQSGLLTITPDFSGVFEYLAIGLQPDFGIGDYPGDIPDLESTAQALYIGNLIGNTSWINPLIIDYIDDTYSSITGGFGFRANTRSLVKYTYYGVQALRMMNDPLVNAYDIKQYILNAQNENGGFGDSIGSLLSYLTHTYWAIETLNLLGEICLQNIDYEQIVNWVTNLKNVDGTYSNYPGFNTTLTSSYRAIQLLTLFNEPIVTNDPLKTTLLDYRQPDGGYLSTLNKTGASVEATFYGVSLSLQLDLEVNFTKETEFVYSLYNDDGGFGERQGFTSSVESTYYALLLLNLLEQTTIPEDHDLYSEYPNDYFSPMIDTGFISKLDTNTSFYGTYLVNVKISDPESRVKDYWAEVTWTNVWGNVSLPLIITDPNSTTCPIYWDLLLGPYYKSGYLEFRIFAEDNNNNTVNTKKFTLKTLDFEIEYEEPKIPIGNYVLYSIGPLFVVIGLVDGLVIYVKRRRRN